jgi:kelch-like protein 2/3
MPTARFAPAAATINNRLYVVGGFPNGGPAYSVVEVYDPQLNAWAPRSPMPTARGRLALGVINNVLYAVGGFSGQPAAQSAVEAYDSA